MGISEEAQRVTSRGAVSSADLGGSSNYKSVKTFWTDVEKVFMSIVFRHE